MLTTWFDLLNLQNFKKQKEIWNHDFREGCFRKLKLLLAANRLIYLNISVSI